jgi:signal transduction histidine kinase
VHARGERIPSPDGVPVVVGTTLDITDSTRSIEELQRYRHQLEELVEQRTAELEESRQRLRHSERLASIGTLSAGLAHQVNNPVGSILAAASYARLCEGDPDEIATLRKGMLDIEAEARRCGEIVRGKLQFASDRPANKKQIAIDPLLESLRSVLRRSEAENAANLSVEYEGPSPLVLASAIELEQALANLIENAFQSRDSGSQVVLRRTTEHGQVRIEIRDDGRGITKEAVGHVLDPFYTSRLERGGTGLGLSVAHGVVRAHDGELRIESEVDVGTTVIVTLPLAR